MSVDIQKSVWDEYDDAAKWCASRGIKGTFGDQLPVNLSDAVLQEINNDVEAFEQRVKDTAYALAMGKLNLPDN